MNQNRHILFKIQKRRAYESRSRPATSLKGWNQVAGSGIDMAQTQCGRGGFEKQPPAAAVVNRSTAQRMHVSHFVFAQKLLSSMSFTL
jgi:hypothetical protein